VFNEPVRPPTIQKTCYKKRDAQNASLFPYFLPLAESKIIFSEDASEYLPFFRAKDSSG